MIESCFNCFYLNREQKEIDKYGNIQYGCDSNGRFGFVPFTVKSEKELKTGGCSDWIGNKIKVGTEFLLNNTVCFYCGSIKTSKGKKYLVYNASTYVQNGFYIDMVEQNWFAKHKREVKVKRQTKEQIEALKQTARLYKKRIIKREEENRG